MFLSYSQFLISIPFFTKGIQTQESITFSSILCKHISAPSPSHDLFFAIFELSPKFEANKRICKFIWSRFSTCPLAKHHHHHLSMLGVKMLGEFLWLAIDVLRKSIIVVVQYLAQSPLSMKPWSAFPEYLLLNGPVQRTLKEITNCETYLDNKPHLEYTKFKKNIFLTEIPCHQTSIGV